MDHLLYLLIVYRIVNTFCVQTYFNPDEFWQGPEVAHRMVYGVGHLTWEWSPSAQIRSAVHPSFFALFYWCVKTIGIDTRFVVMAGPRVLQSILAAVGDFYVYRWSLQIFLSKNVAKWSLFLSLSSFFNFFCITRTFSNSAETVVTIVALYYWPMSISTSIKKFFTASAIKKDDDLLLSDSAENTRKTSRNRNSELKSAESTEEKINKKDIEEEEGIDESSWWLALSLAALAVVLRPTSLLIWLPLGIRALNNNNPQNQMILVGRAIIVGIIALVLWLYIDSLFYGEFTFVLWNFIQFNLLHGLDKLYGSHPW
jgi:GPI mannosyltransferase 3